MIAPDVGGVKPYEREALLDRIDREGATIGAAIPEEVALEDGTVPLRKRVLELQTGGAETNEGAAAADELRFQLRRVRNREQERLETADLDYETGEQITERVIGIDRALEILDDLGSEEDLEARIAAQERADRERWLNFLKQALGQSDEDTRPQGGHR